MCRATTPAVLGLLSAAAMTGVCSAQASAAAQALAAAQAPAAAHVPAASGVPAKSDLTMPQMLVMATVHLDTAADLEHLRETNFFHYLRATKILAAANELCRPKPEHTIRARFDGDPQCGFMWMTSLPPKKQLSFHLDGVHYVALVTVTDDIGKLVQIHDPKR